MDIFIERIIRKKPDYADYLIVFGTILITFAVAFIIMSLAGVLYFGIGLAAVIAIAYIAYRIITSRNVEFEYALTNGDLDIDKIIAKRKRKRLFSGSCRQFEIMAKVSSEKHDEATKGMLTKINAASSMNSENTYFFIAHYDKRKIIVYFEPDNRMLSSIKTMNRKVYE
jgi:hypothetical protein